LERIFFVKINYFRNGKFSTFTNDFADTGVINLQEGGERNVLIAEKKLRSPGAPSFQKNFISLSSFIGILLHSF